MRIDRRMIPEEIPEEVERELIAEIERVCAAIPGISVKTRRILLARPFTPQPRPGGAGHRAAAQCEGA